MLPGGLGPPAVYLELGEAGGGTRASDELPAYSPDTPEDARAQRGHQAERRPVQNALSRDHGLRPAEGCRYRSGLHRRHLRAHRGRRKAAPGAVPPARRA